MKAILRTAIMAAAAMRVLVAAPPGSPAAGDPFDGICGFTTVPDPSAEHPVLDRTALCAPVADDPCPVHQCYGTTSRDAAAGPAFTRVTAPRRAVPTVHDLSRRVAAAFCARPPVVCRT